MTKRDELLDTSSRDASIADAGRDSPRRASVLTRLSRAGRRGGDGPITLHIGTPKSGTTYLQARLRSLRGQLARHSMLYPGAGYLPQGGLNHQPAVYAVAGPEVRWVTEEVRAKGVRYLQKLTAEVRRHHGPVLLSAEAMASFHEPAIHDLLAALGRPAEQVKIVVTARSMERLLTSVWQQNIKNGATHDQHTYLASVARLRGAGPSQFWTAYGLPDLVDRWAAVVGMERICLVIAPATARPGDDLWARFQRACEIDGIPPDDQDGTARVDSNISLTASQAELLREMNVILDAEQVEHRERQRLRAQLLQAWMSRSPGQARKLALAEGWRPTLQEWAAQDQAALAERQAAGLRLVGDLADLSPGPRAVESGPVEPTATETAHNVLTLLRNGSAAARR